MEINPALLSQLFGMNYGVLKMQTAGLTHPDSLRQLPFRGNCLNWVLGHILANRNQALLLLNESPLWSEAEIAVYQTGSAPITPTSEEIQPLARILSDLDQSQERLMAALQRISPEALEKVVGDETVGRQLAGLHFHEAYHAGQTELLRQLAGKNDAIV